MEFNTSKASQTTIDAMQWQDIKGQADAINRSLAVIQFDLDGNILDANENFLKTVGYELSEVKGRHHRIFVDPMEAASTDYAAFWRRLAEGQFQTAQYRRIGQSGREIWIQASYNPIYDTAGRPYKVVKYAYDITEAKLREADARSKLDAINKSQAVIEFDLEGQVLGANENFLAVMGYTLDEIRGKHHRIFVDPAEANGTAYADFWRKLRAGQFDSGKYRRVGKGGREVWIRASYNPILNARGEPVRVLKFASDITESVRAASAAAAVKLTRDVVQRVLDNDLTARVALGQETGEVAELCDGINDVLDRMTEIVRHVSQSAGEIDAACHDILADAEELDGRTSRQLEQMQETTRTMESLTLTVKENVANAKQASELSGAASDVAAKGGEAVGRVVQTMGSISGSARKIEDIISVIDGIAFQTNILALNAAVEAARAGEHGRGFAVVASEVRSLSQRSASAAKEIRGLITDSVNNVQQGSRLVSEAGKTMQDVVAGAQRVADLISGIASASTRQAAAIEDVGSAISDMGTVSQASAEVVRRAGDSAARMDEVARELSDSVRVFRLPAQGRETLHPPAARKAA
ncbi:MAG: methyl-accepting chemotaxis protein [Burkholderiales bacterium]|nr:methyl-accepting chemotaxis protein [Burkholderiales bacterium]